MSAPWRANKELNDTIYRIKMRGLVMRLRAEQRELEERYNHNHDSKGRFARTNSSSGIDSGASEVYNDSNDTPIPVSDEAIRSVPKPDIFADDKCNERVQALCRDLLKDVQGDSENSERSYSITLSDIRTGKLDSGKNEDIGEKGTGTVSGVKLDESYMSIHNHPSGKTISARDVHIFCGHPKEKIMVVIGNNGKLYALEKAHTYADKWVNLQVAIDGLNDDNVKEIVFERAEEYGLKYYES